MKLSVIFSAAACVLAGVALAVSLLHAGPRGFRGPAGQAGPPGHTGHDAQVAHLGVCELNLNDWTAAAEANIYAQLVTAPVLTDGVPSCPSGQFVSIVPQS